MIGNTATKQHANSANRTGWLAPLRALPAAREGAAPAEFAFILGFMAMIAATGSVFVGQSFAGSLNEVSERVETASINMANPLGGGGNIMGSGGSGVQSGGGAGPGNGIGTGNGKNK